MVLKSLMTSFGVIKDSQDCVEIDRYVRRNLLYENKPIMAYGSSDFVHTNLSQLDIRHLLARPLTLRVS